MNYAWQQQQRDNARISAGRARWQMRQIAGALVVSGNVRGAALIQTASTVPYRETGRLATVRALGDTGAFPRIEHALGGQAVQTSAATAELPALQPVRTGVATAKLRVPTPTRTGAAARLPMPRSPAPVGGQKGVAGRESSTDRRVIPMELVRSATPVRRPGLAARGTPVGERNSPMNLTGPATPIGRQNSAAGATRRGTPADARAASMEMTRIATPVSPGAGAELIENAEADGVFDGTDESPFPSAVSTPTALRNTLDVRSSLSANQTAQKVGDLLETSLCAMSPAGEASSASAAIPDQNASWMERIEAARGDVEPYAYYAVRAFVWLIDSKASPALKKNEWNDAISSVGDGYDPMRPFLEASEDEDTFMCMLAISFWSVLGAAVRTGAGGGTAPEAMVIARDSLANKIVDGREAPFFLAVAVALVRTLGREKPTGLMWREVLEGGLLATPVDVRPVLKLIEEMEMFTEPRQPPDFVDSVRAGVTGRKLANLVTAKDIGSILVEFREVSVGVTVREACKLSFLDMPPLVDKTIAALGEGKENIGRMYEKERTRAFSDPEYAAHQLMARRNSVLTGIDARAVNFVSRLEGRRPHAPFQSVLKFEDDRIQPVRFSTYTYANHVYGTLVALHTFGSELRSVRKLALDAKYDGLPERVAAAKTVFERTTSPPVDGIDIPSALINVELADLKRFIQPPTSFDDAIARIRGPDTYQKYLHDWAMKRAGFEWSIPVGRVDSAFDDLLVSAADVAYRGGDSRDTFKENMRANWLLLQTFGEIAAPGLHANEEWQTLLLAGLFVGKFGWSGDVLDKFADRFVRKGHSVLPAPLFALVVFFTLGAAGNIGTLRSVQLADESSLVRTAVRAFGGMDAKSVPVGFYRDELAKYKEVLPRVTFDIIDNARKGRMSALASNFIVQLGILARSAPVAADVLARRVAGDGGLRSNSATAAPPPPAVIAIEDTRSPPSSVAVDTQSPPPRVVANVVRKRRGKGQDTPTPSAPVRRVYPSLVNQGTPQNPFDIGYEELNVKADGKLDATLQALYDDFMGVASGTIRPATLFSQKRLKDLQDTLATPHSRLDANLVVDKDVWSILPIVLVLIPTMIKKEIASGEMSPGQLSVVGNLIKGASKASQMRLFAIVLRVFEKRKLSLPTIASYHSPMDVMAPKIASLFAPQLGKLSTHELLDFARLGPFARSFEPQDVYKRAMIKYATIRPNLKQILPELDV